ncbi:hypothetical protein [Corynebacterium urealyticum]|uniref:hypothetical protein n=1 Tax=Corynebacterium urealyticum TaxID=43771 RepID=UPI0021CCA344|nr:hypothetical protein [Corynebacterium urealyticum]
MPHIVFLDANVLTSTTVLRWLFDLRAALVGEGYELRLVTSLKTLSETGATMNWRVPQSTGAQRDQRMAELRREMDGVLPQYPEGLAFSGKDPGDYHVHAAATACEATTLLSFNRPSDFTKKPARESYRVINPDDFLHELGTTHPGALAQVVATRTGKKGTDEEGTADIAALVLQLKKARCPRLAKLLPGALGG